MSNPGLTAAPLALARPFALTMAFLTAAQLLQCAEIESASAKKTEMKTSTASAGLFNDWWRKENPEAKAWDLGGQFRMRYESKENAGSFANRDFIAQGQANDNDVMILRTKLHLGYTQDSWLNFFVEGRDSRGWWDRREPTPDDDAFDLHQVFVQLGDPKKCPMLLKVGRQEMIYGDERFIGAADWSNTGRVFDAAKLRFENESFWVDAFVGRVVVPYDDHFNVANDYDWFSGLYVSSRKLIPWQETQVFFLARNVSALATNAIAAGVPGSPATARDVYTIGTRIKSLPGKLQGWDYSTELAGQFGSVVQGGVRRDLEAFAADASFGYSWSEAWGTPRVGAEYTYASGDHNAADNKYETFEPLFGTNHKLYGFMDLFGLRNLHNPSVTLSLKPAKQLSLRADYLLFWLADGNDSLYPESGSARSGNGYGRKPQLDHFVGSEVDFIASYQPAAWAEFQFGYGHFFVGDYIKQSAGGVPANGGATDADWVYVQTKITF